MGYFSGLNYSLANEDTSLEYEVLQDGLNHVVGIAGSGARLMPLIAKKPNKISCIDISPHQLYLTELRLTSPRVFDYETYLGFWGYRDPFTPRQRQAAFSMLSLSRDANDFCARLFQDHQWQSILYAGSWEQTFIKLSKLIRMFLPEKAYNIFECRTLEEQQAFFKHEFPQLRWQMCLLTLGNAALFNALLYKGNFVKKNIDESYYQFYRQAFHRIFNRSLARENFFLNLLFFGELKYRDALPFECKPDIFHEVKAGLEITDIAFCPGNAMTLLPNLEPVNFFSFSDVPSYFSGELAKTYIQGLKHSLEIGALLVIRHYLHLTTSADRRGFIDLTGNYTDAIDREGFQVYHPEILQRVAP